MKSLAGVGSAAWAVPFFCVLACADVAVEKRQASVDRNGHWRPQVHFTPPQDWMNDPNGMFLDSKGIWHLYYQYSNSCSSPDLKDWGHTTSTDLFSWQDQPIAIAASDELGSIWSGSSIVDKDNVSGLFPDTDDGKDNVVAFFTSFTGPEESQFLAYSLDGGSTFKNYDSNPVIDLDRHSFRDPKVIFHKETGKFVITVTLTDGVTFYTSPDLKTWTRVSTWTPDPQLGVIECPQLIPIPRRRSATDKTFLGTAYILVLSVGNGGPDGVSIVKYITGTFNGTVFTPAGVVEPGSGTGYAASDFDFGPDVYATAFFHLQTQAYIDGKSDAVSMSWATNIRYGGETPTCASENWRHAMTMARAHWLDARYKLVAVPADTGARQLPALAIVDKKSVPGASANYSALAARANPAIEFNLTIHVPRMKAGQTASAKLRFTASETSERLTLAFNITGASNPTANFTMDRSGMLGFGSDGLRTYTVGLTALPQPRWEHAFTLRGFLDRSILEVFLNGGAEFGTMLYFPLGLLDGLELQQSGDAGLSFDFRAVPLKSSWGNGP